MSITFTLSWITLLFIEASGNYAILWQFSMVLGSREWGVGCRVWGVGSRESGVGSRESGVGVSGQRSAVSGQ
ncbi:MAG: hypothetical protein F6K56_12645 [Moorea sp. SIO3G5]|nr:hypothetical protein [Moorena sp. SIO3G5]